MRDDVIGWGGKHLVTNGVAWRPVSHAGVAHLGVGSQKRPNCVEKRGANQKTGCLGNQ